MSNRIAAGLVFLFLCVVHPSGPIAANPPCSEAEQTIVRRLVDEHKPKIAEAQALMDRQQAINANEALATGHVSYSNAVKLLNAGRSLAEWRQVVDHDIARYTACFGYPPIGLVDYGSPQKPCKTSIVGTWKWWNGLTVSFASSGGASYSGSSSGTGSWQHTSGNSYHAHWNSGNTDDYFTLSSDGRKLQGSFDGKPGTSTRDCS